MKQSFLHKLRCTRGISRAAVILIVIVAVLVVAVSIPTYLYYRSLSKEIGCMSALDSAKRELIDAYLFSYGDLDTDEGKETVTAAMLGWDDLCPGGGVVYIVSTHNEDSTGMPYRLCCGLHDDDKPLCTRLNAKYVYEYVCKQVRLEKVQGNPVPETLTMKLNGRDLEIVLVDENLYLSRGTDYTTEYRDTVAFFGVPGHGFPADEPANKSGVCYFVYADEKYAASVTGSGVWSGSAYGYVTSK